MPKFPYKKLPENLGRDFRNRYNQNLEDIEADIKELNGAQLEALEAADNANQEASNLDQLKDDVTIATDNALSATSDAITATDNANTQAGYAKDQGDYAKRVGNDNKTNWLNPVTNYEDVETTYPSPSHGDTVMVESTGKIYRYENEIWHHTQTYSDTAITNISAQLAETEQLNKYSSNADYPLIIPTYEGSGQTVHPDAIYISNGFAGYKYWMAHTPYPFSNDKFENPSIVCSHDGVTWVNPPGMINPIFLPTSEMLADGHHASDAILVYRQDLNRLECIWRWNKNGSTEQLWVQTSMNGITWTEKKLIFDLTGATTAPTIALSPTGFFEDGKYKIWFIADGLNMYYMESLTGEIGTWSTPIICTIQNYTYRNWHVHVSKIDGLYHAILNANKADTPNVRVLLHTTSSDGKTFDTPTLIMEPRNGQATWDNRSLYRGSLIKVDGMYKLYYSAYSTSSRFYIALTEGEDIKFLRGGKNYNRDGQMIINETKTNRSISQKFLIDGRAKANGAALLEMVRPDVLGVRNDANTRFNDFEARLIYGMSAYLGSGSSRAYLRSDVTGLHVRNALDTEYITLLVNILRTKEIVVTETGLGSLKFKLVEPDVLGITNYSGALRDFKAQNLEGSSLVLNTSVVAKEVEGAIRYNATTKKHEGFDGTIWNPMY